MVCDVAEQPMEWVGQRRKDRKFFGAGAYSAAFKRRSINSVLSIMLISMEQREAIIRNYIGSYNRFDIEGMLGDFDSLIVFENISDGEVNMTISGIADFREQAAEAAYYFSERTQAIKSVQHDKDNTTVEILYTAVPAVDLPNGLRKGERFTLEGKSVFTFSGNKIIKLVDIS